jgi:4-diphosphocytidyl-2-C-methyl-D-erythritol kinase
MKRLTLISPAKINLYLDVLGRRPDGYHELATLFERVSLADTLTLTVTRTPGIKIASNDPRIPCDETNLAHKAAVLLFKESGVKAGCRIHIKKVIPIGGGMGGGSSNAACVLMGLNRLLGKKLSKKRLIELADRLGSDVAFFILEKPFAVGRGRGNQLEPVRMNRPLRLWHVLVAPPVQALTAAVYRAYDAGDFRLTTPGLDVNICLSYLRKRDAISLDRCLFNRLSEVVYRSMSLVSDLKRDLCEFGKVNVHMSGSGTTLFTIHGSRREAERLARLAKRRWRGRCRVLTASTF